VNQEFQCLGITRMAKQAFFAKIVGHAKDHLAVDYLSADHRKRLRSSDTMLVAELLFMLRTSVSGRPDMLASALEAHNEALRVSIEDAKNGYSSSGVPVSRLKKALIGVREIERLRGLDPIGFEIELDQSSISKLLVESMSPEQCRLTLLALSDCGLLKRRSRKLSQEISSDGTLEGFVEEYLSTLIKKLAEL